MRVQALFCDYDGTLAPLQVSRAQSRIPGRLADALRRVHQSIPLAIVTAKDYSFIHERTAFADAWSCVYGFETITRQGIRRVGRIPKGLTSAERVGKKMPNHPRIESKRTSTGAVCGLCVEWNREDAPNEEIVNSGVSEIRKSGLQAFYDPSYPMVDVLPAGHDKGVAVETLKEMLGVREGLMYVGDSPSDNPAFAEAEVSVGVLGAWPQRNLECDYLIDGRALGRFLLALLKNNLEFSKVLPGIRANES